MNLGMGAGLIQVRESPTPPQFLNSVQNGSYRSGRRNAGRLPSSFTYHRALCYISPEVNGDPPTGNA